MYEQKNTEHTHFAPYECSFPHLFLFLKGNGQTCQQATERCHGWPSYPL